MSGIKYYTIRDGEELPDEFAVIENVGGEPEIRAWYSRNDQLTAENAKLRELLAETLMDVHEYADKYGIEPNYDAVNAHLDARMRELGIEVGV